MKRTSIKIKNFGIHCGIDADLNCKCAVNSSSRCR